MKATLLKIGNSHGVRLPKSVIEQCGFKREIAMSVEDGAVVLRPKRKPREGWEEAFDKADMSGQDEAIWPDGMANKFDDTEWQWKK